MAAAEHLPIIGWISIAGFLLVAPLATRNRIAPKRVDAVVWIGVITLNRPKFAVPPHLRDRPGLFGARGARSQRLRG